MNTDELKALDQGAYDLAYLEWQEQCEFMDYADCVIDDFIDDMEDVGVTIDSREAVNYTGFWSQGDGASFEATVYPGAAFWEDPDDGKTALLAAVVDELEPIVQIYRMNSRYSHEMTMQIECADLNDIYHEYEGERLEEGMYKGMLITDAMDIIGDLDDYATDILDACREYARDLYKRLEAEYEYQTSEERFDEYLDDFGFEYDAEEHTVTVL